MDESGVFGGRLRRAVGADVAAGAGGIDPRKLLAANDSYRLFSALGDLVLTGPTRTNVNDYRAILITPA